MTGRRPERLAEQIKEEVSLIVAGDLEDPRIGFAIVTDAKMSPDLRHARIYVSVLGTDEEIEASIATLNHAAGFVRRQLGATLRLKHTPELHFVYDETLESAERIEKILSEEVVKDPDREKALRSSKPPEPVSPDPGFSRPRE
ncbi:MAG TPA: 30S ribosome-binding factor RbfA [Blastocatellia bacterium]|nr:30S ribosome-binding factor RbfA [Blastocatellia bacterium]